MTLRLDEILILRKDYAKQVLPKNMRVFLKKDERRSEEWVK